MKPQPIHSRIRRWLASYGQFLERKSPRDAFAEGFRAGWKAHQRYAHQIRSAAVNTPKGETSE